MRRGTPRNDRLPGVGGGEGEVQGRNCPSEEGLRGTRGGSRRTSGEGEGGADTGGVAVDAGGSGNLERTRSDDRALPTPLGRNRTLARSERLRSFERSTTEQVSACRPRRPVLSLSPAGAPRPN